MKINKLLFGLMASGITLAGITQSCVSDEPFGYGDGEGTLRMQLVVNSDLTRAVDNEDDLRANCKVYISGNEGLLYKYDGLENVPDYISMKSGSYMAEAWTGDSVTASFDKKFFRGFQRFNITQDNQTSVVLTCKIANVVVSINEKTVDPELMKDWKITVFNSRGQLEFDENNMTYAKGYFMMPNSDIKLGENGEPMTDGEGWLLYTNLKYRIEGTTASGDHFVKEGLIEGSKKNGIVEHAHDYILNLVYNPDYEVQGGSFVTVVVDDYEEVVTEEIGLYSRPAIKGVGFEIESLIKGSQGDFKDHIIKVSGFGDITNIDFEVPDFAAMHLPARNFDLITMTENRRAEFKALGIEWDYKKKEDKNLASSYITLSSAFLNNIPRRDDEAYVMTVTARDSYGKEHKADIRIGVGEVQEDPVVVEAVPANPLMQVMSKRATLYVTVGADAQNAGVEYRIAGTSDPWSFAAIPLTRTGQTVAVTIYGLQPGKTYEYRAKADGFTSRTVQKFTTETEFLIPNASMEDWSNYTDKIIIPGAGGQRTFWDTGNHGSSTMNVTLTNGSTDMFHTGSKSAKLNSMFVGLGGLIGKLAAGNLFVGNYARTSGTNGVIDFGRPYDGSHPDNLRVWVNYRPAKVSSTGKHLTSTSQYDEGQIYVAFTTGIVTVDTSKESTLFNKDSESVLGYGEFNFTGNYGDDNSLKELVIPVKWKTGASKTKPTHMIIVCSASRYGDYFEGGNGSVMYVDDFEFVY